MSTFSHSFLHNPEYSYFTLINSGRHLHPFIPVLREYKLVLLGGFDEECEAFIMVQTVSNKTARGLLTGRDPLASQSSNTTL